MQGRKLIVNLLCAMVPFPKWRRALRGYLLSLGCLVEQIMIPDWSGSDFKQYIATHAMEDKLDRLMRNLDPDSRRWVHVFWQRMLNLPNHTYFQTHRMYLNKRHTLRTEKEQTMKAEFEAALPALRTRYTLPRYLPEVVLFEHGLPLLPDATRQRIVGHDALDLGAYIGDSAIVLRNYHPSRIFAVEGDHETIAKMKQTFAANKLDPGAVEIIEGMIGDGTDGTLRVDDLVERYAMRPALIKADIEGAEFPMLRGAERTLSTFKPILAVSIYHRPEDFFEIKPYLEQRVPEYQFKITLLSPKSASIVEATLLAYPKP